MMTGEHWIQILNRVVLSIWEGVGLVCMGACGHRLGPWVVLLGTGRFEQARCWLCRHWVVRPRPYHTRRIIGEHTAP